MSAGILSDVLLLYVLAYLAGGGGKSYISHAAYSRFYLFYRVFYARNRGFTRFC